MANNILLPPQVIEAKKLTVQFPPHGFPSRKIFFQCELRAITNGDAIFGVIAYPAWRRGNALKERWIIGTKVTGITAGPAGPDETFPVNSGDPLDPFTAFGNNEISVPYPALSNTGQKSDYTIQRDKFIEAWNKIVEDEKLLEKTTLNFKAKISKNPHAEYDITLSSPASTTTLETNPSPPDPPEEG